MTEKIHGAGFRAADAAGARRAETPRSPAQATPAAKHEGTGDTVQLTPSALLLAKLEDAIRGVPTVDSERVAALKAAIDAGSYEVDAAAVADGLLRAERELAR